jgi:hypothetical protein
MELKTDYKELIEKKQKLEQTRVALKDRFLGIDDVIDEVIALMMPWYLFPGAQRRPTIVNLWGLTGSGKTALVQALVELLEYKSLYSHIDMGEFDSNSASWMKNILTNDLDFFNQKPALICLDEFQFAKTLNGQGNELSKDKLRVVWDLLDSGKIQYIPGDSTYYLFKAENCHSRLQKAILLGLDIHQGKIERGFEEFSQIFNGFYFDYNDGRVPVNEWFFMSNDFIYGMINLFENEQTFTRLQMEEKIKVMTVHEVAQFIRNGMNTRGATKTLDLSHALLFVLGNLDEAYTMSHSMNPDISADDFHEQTSKITIADIKRALRKRFRPEQIARLGNNHVIYRSFNNAQFRMLIRQELKRVAEFVRDQFSWRVSFDESVVDIVYAEGVFPAQGTRPVLTTIKNLIESKVSSLVVSILEYQLKVEEITWRYSDGQFEFDLKNDEGTVVSTITDKAKLKIENLRKSVDPEIQAHTAVHEAGHAVLAALTLRIIPSVVVSRTASDMEGFCMVNFPKGPITRETLKKDIIITLGGLVAEKMIFGEEMTCSGVISDIEEASKLANRAIRQYAMGSDPIRLTVECSQNDDAFKITQRYATEAVEIIKACEVEATEILSRNKLLLLKMAEYLTTQSRMEEADIEKYVRNYGAEDWIRTDGFIKKENYYRFNSALQKELERLENGSPHLAVVAS